MIRKLIDIATGGSASDKKIMMQSASTFSINVISYLLAFAVMLALTRSLGAEDYGAYSFAFASLSFLGVLALLGFDKLLVRDLAKHAATGNPGLVRGIFRWSSKLLISSSVFLAIVGYAVSYLPIELFKDHTTVTTYRIMMIGVPIYVLIVQRQSALQGMKQVVRAQVHDKLVRPLSFLLLIGVGFFLLPGWDVIQATIMAVIAFFIALIVGEVNYRMKSKGLEIVEPDRSERKTILNSSGILLLYASMSILSTKLDIFMLGGMQSSTDKVGIYTVSLRMADLINFFLVAFNLVLAPTMAGLLANGKIDELQNTLVRAARLILVFSVPVIIFLALARDWYLPLFGEEFTEASTPLLILVCAQFFSVATGSVGYLLLMSKNERFALYTLTISTIMNAILNFVLIPDYGILGAAIATACSISLNNLMMLTVVLTKLRINPTAIGRIRKIS